ncbi:MAG: YhfC family intramembrane metalloprotease [Roseburia sp.]|nr:YhfC family intramembrane metalloprotease [Roseburia sp.]
MNDSVSNATLVMIVINLLLGFLIPAVLCIVMGKKSGGSLKAFFVGCGTMLLFAFILEGAINFLVSQTGAGALLLQNIWGYALYGGFMAGLFEETGRFVAFRTILRKNWDKDGNALMYGAGHGGFETFYILVFGMLNNLIYAVVINAGMADMLTAGLEGAQLAAVEGAFAQLSAASPLLFLAAPLERLLAIALQLSLSVLVWFAAKKGGRTVLLYPLAILLHLVVDAVTVLLSNAISNTWILEGVILVFTLGYAFLARWIWKKEKEI